MTAQTFRTPVESLSPAASAKGAEQRISLELRGVSVGFACAVSGQGYLRYDWPPFGIAGSMLPTAPIPMILVTPI